MDNKRNKQIISEYLLLSKAPQEALQKAFSDKGYSIYYHNMKDLYTTLNNRFASVLGIQRMRDEKEIIEYLSKLVIDSKKEIEIHLIEQEPLFIKLVGESTLQKSSNLENLIGVKFSSESFINGYERNAEEFIRLDDKNREYKRILEKLFMVNVIPEEKYIEYTQQLKYLFDYLMSISKGEQKQYKKISDYEHKSIENTAPKHI